jgi:hypothetical protein
VLEITEKVISSIVGTSSLTRKEVEEYLERNKDYLHWFNDGVILARNNELHVHFVTNNWYRVKNKLTSIIQPLLVEYDYVWTKTDIPNARRALKLFGAIERDGKFVLTRERFKNVWCK